MLEQTLGKIPEALNDFGHAVKADPKFAEAWANRATLRRTQPEPDLKAAMTDADKAVEVDPLLAAAYSARGFVRLDLGDAAGALEDFNKAVSLRPDLLHLAQALTGQGVAVRRAHKDLNAAIDSFDKAIRANPRYYEAYSARGLAKHDNKDYSGAIADYTQAIEINGQAAGLYHNRGASYAARAEDRTKEAMHRRATKAPGVEDEEKAAKEQWKLAINDFDKAIELDPKIPQIYEQRGVVRHLLGDDDGAITDFNRAIELKPDSSVAFINRGLVWELKGKFTNALEDYNHAVEANRYDPIAYARRGLLYLQYQQDLRASQDFEACFELQPKLRPQLEVMIGQIKEARKQAKTEGKN